jgi:hypothetical protein
MILSRITTSARRTKVLSVAILLVFAGLLGSPASAQGTSERASARSTVDLSCNISFQFEFGGPSLTYAKGIATLGFCTSPNGSHPELSAASVTGKGTASGCPQGIITGTSTDDWVTADLGKDKSKLTFTLDLVRGTSTATVTSGVLKGDTITISPVSALTTAARCPNGQTGLKRIFVPNTTVTFSH